jgi:hypothetical protein
MQVITAEDKKMRLPWWGVLCVMVGALPLYLLFVYFGRFDLARPTLYSIAMIAIAIAMRWKLRRHAWFWITMAVIAALHVLLILSVPWNTKWVPAIVIIPLGIGDLYAMLAILSAVGKFVERPKYERPRP